MADGVRVASINVIEPLKRAIAQVKPGHAFERKALAVLLDRNRWTAYEVTVD